MGEAIRFPSVVLIVVAVMACITQVPGKTALLQIRGSNLILDSIVKRVSCSLPCNSMHVIYYMEESFKP